MSSKPSIKIQSGSTVTVQMSNGLQRMAETVEAQLLPKISDIINESLSVVLENAKKNWLVRAKESENSIGKFEKEIFVSSDGKKIKGLIRNKARYAYVITVGRKSKTSFGNKSDVDKGERVWKILVEDPVKEKAIKIQEQITKTIQVLQQEIVF